jgi:hypothetical protein
MAEQRLSDSDVERMLGFTPCVCGDLETWHFGCYRGKTKEQIADGYKRAFRLARAELKRRLANTANSAITRASGDRHG